VGCAAASYKVSRVSGIDTEKMTAKPVRARPLSPHLQIYRWPVTMATSIVHRITGVGLGAGVVIVAWWLIAAAMGPAEYALFQHLAGGILGRLVLFGFTLALMYHLLNGVRHLVWDAGQGFSLKSADASGVFVFIGAGVLTLGLWTFAYMMEVR
jgi:succinate dehydrogenase / fumarate reductase cytochrome b subunit